METKICKKCGRELPIEEFYKGRGMKDGHLNVCKECFKLQTKQCTKQHRKNNPEYQKQYRQTPMWRASYLVSAYKYNDKKYNRGECTLTAKWVLDNILMQPCKHCKKEGWKVIGCNRLDNSKPHTMDNVEPCCEECNKKLAGEEKKTIFSKQVYQYTLDGELVTIWPSINEVGRNGYNKGNVSSCCRGKLNKYKNYIWNYDK